LVRTVRFHKLLTFTESSDKKTRQLVTSHENKTE